MATERLILEFQAKGTRTVARDVNRIKKEASSANKTLALLRSTLVVVAGARVIRRFLELADSLTNIRNRLRLVTNSTEQLNAVQQRLFQISQETRSSFDANAVLFNRLARSTDGLKLTFNELLGVTRGITQALAISGATSQEARSALIQFSQGLAAGAVRGDELRSVVEQLPRLADAIAKEFSISGETTARSLGVTEEALKSVQKETGSLSGGALIAFAKVNEGVLKTGRVIKAIQNDLGNLDAEFSKIDITAGQAFVRFENNLTLFVGGLSNSVKLGAQLDKVLTLIAQNLDVILVALVAIGGIAIFNLLTSQILKFASSSGKVLSFLTSGFTDLFKIIRGGIGLLVRAGTVIGAVFSAGLLPVLAVIALIVQAFFLWRTAIRLVEENFGDLGDTFNTIGGAIVGTVNGIIDAFELIPAAISDIAIRAANFLVERFTAGVNSVINILNRLPNVDIAPAAFEGFENEFEGKAKLAGDALRFNIEEGIRTGFTGTNVGTAITDFVDKLKGFQILPEDFSEARLKALLDQISGTRDGLADFNKESDKAANSIRKIRASVDPAEAAFKKLNDAFEAFEKLGKANARTTEFATETLRLLAEQLAGVADEEFKLGQQLLLVATAQEKLGLSAERAALARKQFANEALQDTASILQGTLPLIDARAKLLEVETQIARLKVNNRLNDEEAAEAQRRLTRAAFGFGQTAEQVGEQIKFLRDNQKLLGLSTSELEAEIRRLNIAFLDTQRDAASGANRAFLRLLDDATNAAKFTEMVFTDAFDAIGDAVVKFVETGKFSLNDFFRNFAAQLIKLGTNQALSGIGGVFTQLLGGKGGFGFGGPSGGGLAGPGGGIAGLISGLLPFQNGGSFTVGANTAVQSLPGIDNRLIAFRARDGEDVQVTPRGGGGTSMAPVNQVFNITTPNADSFVRSQTQIQNRALAGIDARRRRR